MNLAIMVLLFCMFVEPRSRKCKFVLCSFIDFLLMRSFLLFCLMFVSHNWRYLGPTIVRIDIAWMNWICVVNLSGIGQGCMFYHFRHLFFILGSTKHIKFIVVDKPRKLGPQVVYLTSKMCKGILISLIQGLRNIFVGFVNSRRLTILSRSWS